MYAITLRRRVEVQLVVKAAAVGKNSLPLLKQIVGRIYNLLSPHNLTTLDHLKNKWEENLNEQIADAIWQKIIQRIYSSSICQRLAIVQFKISTSTSSKVRLSRIRLELDPTCDRCTLLARRLILFQVC